MIEFVAWFVLCATLGVLERRLMPARQGAFDKAGLLTDHLMIMTTVVAVAGPPVLAFLEGGASSFVVVIVGWTLAVGGLLLRSIAMVVLGQRYQLTPGAVPAQPEVVSSGPYGAVRHPGYTGLLLTFVGLSLAFGRLLPVVCVLPMLLCALIRIYVEERILTSEFGLAYRAYKREVRWRLVPGVF